MSSKKNFLLKFDKIFLFFCFIWFFFFIFSKNSFAQTSAFLLGDANRDGKVDGLDYVIWLSYYGNIYYGPEKGDFNQDGKVDGLDYVIWLNNYGASLLFNVSPTLSYSPTSTQFPLKNTSPTITLHERGNIDTKEWIQHGHDAQRTSYTDQVVLVPWKWKWSWNGPGSKGEVSYGKTSLPRNVQPITGNKKVFIAAGNRGVFALDSKDGKVLWNLVLDGSFNSTLGYDPLTQSVFAVSDNGILYKLSSSDGNVIGSFNANAKSSLPLPPLLLKDRVIFSMGNKVIAVDKQSMNPIWVYNYNFSFATPPSYSQVKDSVIVISDDLYVHSINNLSGKQIWKVKPIKREMGDPGYYNSNLAEAKYGWPVVADSVNCVIVRYRLDYHSTLNVYGFNDNPWPSSNSEIRSLLQSRPDLQSVFALNLDSGASTFILNVGPQGWGDGFVPIGPPPAIKKLSNGKEVLWMSVRGGKIFQENADRWDSHFGEVVLDSSTVEGFSAGDIRWIDNQTANQSSRYPTDEPPFTSVAGNYLFGGHWMMGFAREIVDRSSTRGTFSLPILSNALPHFVSSSSSTAYSSSHYSSNMLWNDGDGRAIPFGFYIYYKQPFIYDRYWSDYAQWVISDNLILYRSTDGAIIALENGNPLAKNNSEIFFQNDFEILEHPKAISLQNYFDFFQSFVDVIANLYKNNVLQVVNSVYASNLSMKKVLSPDDAHSYVELENDITIKGKIADVFNNGKYVYLTFYKPHQKQFLIKIPLEKAKSFINNPETYYKTGQTILVTGNLKWYQGGPAMYVENENSIILVEDRIFNPIQIVFEGIKNFFKS